MAQIVTWKALLEIALLSVVIYLVLLFLRGGRGAGILRGLGAVMFVAVAVLLLLAQSLELYVLNWLAENAMGYLLIALIVIFQPELRSALVRVGLSPVFARFFHERRDVSAQIARAVIALSRERTGALIALQRSVGLRTYTDGGIGIDALVSSELLVTIFKKNSPLHDGAVVVRGDRVIAAACLFPLSENPDFDTSLGTRHRAAIGVTEESDAVSVVVSEETGIVSVAQNGTLTRGLDEPALRKLLQTVSSEETAQTASAEGLAQ